MLHVLTKSMKSRQTFWKQKDRKEDLVPISTQGEHLFADVSLLSLQLNEGWCFSLCLS